MDVLVGPTLSFDVPPPPPARDRPTGTVFFAGESSDSSSSIGTPDDSDHENDLVSPKRNREEEEEDEEVQSKLNGLSSLDSLEDSLPIKRGLSSHFIGKSKSFTDLSQVTTVKELQKQENPFNKRRRVLIAAKLSRRSFYTWSNPKSMPLLPVDEDEDDDENEAYNNNNNNKEATKVSPSSSSSSSSSAEDKRKPQEQVLLRQHNIVPHSYAAHTRLRLGSFKSRSFSLADLQEHEEEEEGGEEDNDVQLLG